MLPAVPGAGAQLAAAAAPKGEKAKKPLARLPNAALPSEWHLPSGRGYTQLSFATCQLTKLPTLQEGEGAIRPSVVAAAMLMGAPLQQSRDGTIVCIVQVAMY